VVRPNQASVVNTAPHKAEKVRPVIAMRRRSNMSATAPAGTATSIRGSINAVCTSATRLGDDVSRVISHAAPTPRINCPKLDSTLVSQMRRKTVSRSGSNAPPALPLDDCAGGIWEGAKWEPRRRAGAS